MTSPATAGIGLWSRKSAATSVYEFDPLTDSRWEKFVRDHPRSSVFHSSNWLRALQQAYGYETCALTTCPQGTALSNSIVFCRVNSWLTGRRLVSLPFSDHCEPLANDPAELNDLLVPMRRDVDGGRWKYLEVRPIDSAPGHATGLGRSTLYRLHRLGLGESTQELFRRFHKSCVQSKVRRAEREKLIYDEGSSDLLLQQFYALLVMTRRRLFMPPQPQSWFRALIRSFGPGLKIRVVSKDGMPVASILTLAYKKTMLYKYGCSDVRFNSLGGMALLFWNTIQEAKEKGFNELDMGRSDTNNRGLITFKEHWGAVSTHLNYWRYPSQAPASAHVAQDRLRRLLIPRMPGPILQMAGSLLYGHMG